MDYNIIDILMDSELFDDVFFIITMLAFEMMILLIC